LLQEQISLTEQNIRNQRGVYNSTRQQLRQQLQEFDNIRGNSNAQNKNDRASSSTIYIYKMFLAQEKALYMSLN
jgi:hypothetical protein